MPADVGNTLFVHWLAQRQAQRSAQQQAQAAGVDQATRESAANLAQREADRKDLESAARVAEQTGVQIGKPALQLEDPEMALQAEVGRREGALEQLRMMREERKMKEQTARQEYLARLRGDVSLQGIEARARAQRELQGEVLEPGRMERARIPVEGRRSLEEEVLEPGRMERAGMVAQRDITRASRPTTGRAKEIQKRLDEIKMSELDLDEIERAVPKRPDGTPDYAQMHTYGGRLKLWALKEVDKIPGLRDQLSSETQKWLAEGAGYRSILDKQRAEEFRAALGAAQTTIEIKNLINSVLSAQMSPTQIEATMRSLRGRLGRERQVIQQSLSQGYAPSTQITVPGVSRGKVKVDVPGSGIFEVPAENIGTLLVDHPDAKVIQ